MFIFLILFQWTVNGQLRVGFFTTKAVTAGTELTFDYQFQRYGYSLYMVKFPHFQLKKRFVDSGFNVITDDWLHRFQLCLMFFNSKEAQKCFCGAPSCRGFLGGENRVSVRAAGGKMKKDRSRKSALTTVSCYTHMGKCVLSLLIHQMNKISTLKDIICI